jgi:PAS domain S-box-containing protein
VTPPSRPGSKRASRPTPESTDPLATEAALRVVIETALAAVVTMSQDGLVTGWNAKAQEVFGWPKREVIGRQLVDFLVPPAYRDAHTKGIAHYKATGEGPVLGQVLELSAMHQRGHEFPVEIRISPAVNVGDQTTFIAFIFDITERKRAAERMAALYEEARAASEELASLINTIVHGVRTPLMVIAAYTELMQSGSYGEVPERWDEPIRTIATNAEEVSELVDKMLIAARQKADQRGRDAEPA